MELIYLQNLMRLLDCDSPYDWCFYDDCIIDDDGIRAKPMAKHSGNLLIGKEWDALKECEKEFKKDIKLDLPCTREVFIKWAEQNKFDFDTKLADRFSKNPKKGKTRNELRSEDFKKWVKEKSPDLDDLKKAEIHKQLIERNSGLWASGFYDWWKYQDIHKGKQGRKPRK